LNEWKTIGKKYFSANPIALFQIGVLTPGLRLDLLQFKADDYGKFIQSKADWMTKYQHFLIFAPDSYEAALSKVHSFLSSPFLPSELIPHLQSVQRDLESQTDALRTALNNMADDVGKEIDSEEDFFSKADTFFPKIVRVLPDLLPKSNAISSAIRKYIDVDTLLKP